jgi:hypothetical protein
MALKTPQRRLTYTEGARVYAHIANKLSVPQHTVSYCLKQPITPVKQQGRHPIRQQLIAHASFNHEQRLKPRKEIAHELGINVYERTLVTAFEKDQYF